ATKDDITELKNSLQTTVDALKTLETSFRQSSTPRSEGNSDGDGNRGNDNGNQNKGNPNQPQPLNIDPLAFMEDPQDSVRRLANEMLAPITLHSLNVAADMAYNMAKQRLPFFDRFETEIKEMWNKYTPVQKQKPDELIENLYNLVRGRHVDEILTDTNKKDGKYNLVQSGGTAVVGRPGADGSSGRKPEDDLSPKELEIAARFGMTPQEWAAQKGGLKYV